MHQFSLQRFSRSWHLATHDERAIAGSGQTVLFFACDLDLLLEPRCVLLRSPVKQKAGTVQASMELHKPSWNNTGCF
jgi:hypothetical protein